MYIAVFFIIWKIFCIVVDHDLIFQERT